MKTIQFPAYFRITMLLILSALVVYVLSVAKTILVPLALALLVSLLLLPICQRLERWHVPRIGAILLCLLLVISMLAGLIFFLSQQIMSFSDELPEITKQFTKFADNIQEWVTTKFGIDSEQQINYLKDGAQEIASYGGTALSSTAGATGSVLTVLGLLPIYIFFLLYYREFFREFTFRLFDENHRHAVAKVQQRIRTIVLSYLTGLMIVVLILSVLNITGLMIIGVKNAIFFGVMAGLLNILPYVGTFIGSILPILYALISMDSLWYPAAVAALFIVVQQVEGNFITPNIVGSKVSLNPLAAIVALLIGGSIWGLVGMVLAIPFTAIFKVICDAVPGMHPIGFLLGEPAKEMKPEAQPEETEI